VRIYDDELIVWNPGGLPLGLTVEDLFKPHPSVLRNKGIGGGYDMGLIEQWGSGIEKMRKACVKAGIPEPKFEEHQGFRVIFRKDIYTEEYLQKLGLNERQIKAVIYVKEKGKITNKEYQGVCNISERTATRDLSNLVSLGLFMQIGVTGKGTEYILTRHKDAIRPIYLSPLAGEGRGEGDTGQKNQLHHECILNVSVSELRRR
jgi:ATP-dependent DNA helicase RecG